MDHGIWTKPVVFERYGYPGIITVTSTYEAARLLFGLYAMRKTFCLRDALVTCLNVINGQANPGMARYEFIDAVIASGFTILPETFLGERLGQSVDITQASPRHTTRWSAASQADIENRPSAKALFQELFRIGTTLVRMGIDRSTSLMTRSRMGVSNRAFSTT